MRYMPTLRVPVRGSCVMTADLVDEPLRRLHLEDLAQLRCDRVERRRVEGETHAPLGAELVDQQRQLGPFDVLEQERGPAGFHSAVVDLRDFELRIDLGGNTDELTLALEAGDPITK